MVWPLAITSFVEKLPSGSTISYSYTSSGLSRLRIDRIRYLDNVVLDSLIHLPSTFAEPLLSSSYEWIIDSVESPTTRDIWYRIEFQEPIFPPATTYGTSSIYDELEAAIQTDSLSSSSSLLATKKSTTPAPPPPPQTLKQKLLQHFVPTCSPLEHHFDIPIEYQRWFKPVISELTTSLCFRQRVPYNPIRRNQLLQWLGETHQLAFVVHNKERMILATFSLPPPPPPPVAAETNGSSSSPTITIEFLSPSTTRKSKTPKGHTRPTRFVYKRTSKRHTDSDDDDELIELEQHQSSTPRAKKNPCG